MRAGGQAALWVPLLAAALSAAPQTPAAQTVCRPTALGDFRCLGPQSAARFQWPLFAPSNGLASVQGSPTVPSPGPWRADSFGTVRPRQGGPLATPPPPRRCSRATPLGRLSCE